MIIDGNRFDSRDLPAAPQHAPRSSPRTCDPSGDSPLSRGLMGANLDKKAANGRYLFLLEAALASIMAALDWITCSITESSPGN